MFDKNWQNELQADAGVRSIVSTIPIEVRERAREICEDFTGADPDTETDGGYGPGWSPDGNHTTEYAPSEPMWLAFVEDAEAEIRNREKPA